MTEPHTFLPEWFQLRFRVSLERWRWHLGMVDGDLCVIPEGRDTAPPFTGDPELLDRLIELSKADDEQVVRFVNRFGGLFAEAGAKPIPEIVAAIRSEAVVLDLLRATGRLGLAVARASSYQRAGLLRSSIPVDLLDKLDGAGQPLADALEDLRPRSPGSLLRSLGRSATKPTPHDWHSPEWQLLEWTTRTVDEHWRLVVPVEDWLKQPMHERDRALARPLPEIRCLTLLGYAYAQLITELQLRTETASAAVARPHLCRRCGALLSDVGGSGRRRRSDTKWCESCRRSKNAERQRVRRQRVVSPYGSTAGLGDF
jgi:hypothetical protein